MIKLFKNVDQLKLVGDVNNYISDKEKEGYEFVSFMPSIIPTNVGIIHLGYVVLKKSEKIEKAGELHKVLLKIKKMLNDGESLEALGFVDEILFKEVGL